MDYYSFGLKIAGISSTKLGDTNEGNIYNKNLYNDKELIDEGDLNWYDYGFRNYDPQIGRFPQLDPLTWDYPELTNYQYASNEPIANIDIDGLEKGSAISSFLTPVAEKTSFWLPQAGQVLKAAPKVAEAGAKAGANLVKRFVVGAIITTTNTISNISQTVPKNEGGDNASPWNVGAEWLTGTGPKEHNFKNGDPFTELLKQHNHIKETRKMVANNIAKGGALSGPNDYRLDGLQGVPKYLKDYSTLLTFGKTGNIAATYLGSYNLRYKVMYKGSGNRTALVKFTVTNDSTISSATHPPVIGYTKWWNKYIGTPLDKSFSTGPLSKTTQTFKWTEAIKW